MIIIGSDNDDNEDDDYNTILMSDYDVSLEIGKDACERL